MMIIMISQPILQVFTYHNGSAVLIVIKIKLIVYLVFLSFFLLCLLVLVFFSENFLTNRKSTIGKGEKGIS